NWYQSKLVYDHPEYQAVDRSGKKVQYGILEWAYPEARRHWVEDVRQLVDRYDVDGIYMDTRTESPCPEFADQFGFNEPVVREYYGPLARQFGIRLYLSCNPYRPRPFSEPCCQHRAAPSVPPAAKNWCDGLRGMTEFAGTLERQAF